LIRDVFRTIESRSEYREKIERSEFLGLCFPCATEEQFMTELEAARKRYFDATHHCWAFRLFTENRARSSDAGEPSGSAGKPILSAIEAADLFDVGVVVVRWYGGVKLGTGGLSRAYRSSAAGAIANAAVVERYLYDRVSVIVPFERTSDAYRLIEPPAVLLANEEYGETNVFHFDVRRSLRDQFEKKLVERRLTFVRVASPGQERT
jgi:uncharacterized YigZ family protein